MSDLYTKDYTVSGSDNSEYQQGISTGKRSKSKSSSRSNHATRKKTPKGPKRKMKINFGRLALFMLVIILIIALSGMGIVFAIIKDTPDIDPSNIYSLLSESSVILDDTGEKYENVENTEQRTSIAFSQIPLNLQNAFIAIEDKTFWDHKGFNFVRLVGATLNGIFTSDRIAGTSTISQQLARNLYLEEEKSTRSVTRKIKEAYYTVELEKRLSKEQILEAYLNTIYLGNGANGIQAAAYSYFSKDVSELTIAECAILAGIPKSPSKFSPVVTLDTENVDDSISEEDILYKGSNYTLVYSDKFSDRQETVLALMLENGFITEEERAEALAQDIRETLNPQRDVASSMTSYFTDSLIKEVINDFMADGMDEESARYRVYNGGLQIYSTLNVNMQKIAETEFSNNANFPGVRSLKKDSAGNVIDSVKKILLYKYSNYFDENDNFFLNPDDYQIAENGDMKLFADRRLNFYITKKSDGTEDITIDFKNIYNVIDDRFYSYNGGALRIPSEVTMGNGDIVKGVKSFDSGKNVIIKKEFMERFSTYFADAGGGKLTVVPSGYVLRQKVVQPQAAIAILDYLNGDIKTLVGGRNVEGRLLFNRATNPNPPGSSIKPIGVYAPALEIGKTAATVIDDSELTVTGKVWPKNWYSGYKGLVTIREAVQQSMNVPAVKMHMEVGVPTSIDYLKKFGITTIVEEGPINDQNSAALALGGMTNGISPLEMAAAYGTMANEGVYLAPKYYTKVTNRKGDVILEKKSKSREVLVPGVASIMTDILRSTVTNGIAGAASIGSMPVAGKTGTTSNNYDAWFVGFTPYYAAAIWIGNDIDIELTSGSTSASKVWSKIMKQVHTGYAGKSFKMTSDVVSSAVDTKSGMLPSELSEADPRGSTVRTEYFVKGTVPVAIDDVHVISSICTHSNFLATPYCPSPNSKVMIRRPEGMDGAKAADLIYEEPKYYCHLHNPDINEYPISPDVTYQTYVPSYPLPGNEEENEGNSEETTDSQYDENITGISE